MIRLLSFTGRQDHLVEPSDVAVKARDYSRGLSASSK